jgi:hypothetical protein
MSCAVLFDLERGELAEDDDDSGLPKGDAAVDGMPPTGDARLPDGSDVRVAVDGSDARVDQTVDGAPSDTVNNDVPRGDSVVVDITSTDTVVDAPRFDGGIDVTPPSDAPIDSTPPNDVSQDAPRDMTADPVIDNSQDPIVDTRPADTTTDPGVTCSPSTCPTGCCNGNTCVPYASQSNASCGVGGGACAPCGINDVCSKSSNGCQFQCNPTSCPAGCCNGNTCVPYASQSNTTCGVAGNACAPCATNNTCTQSSNGCQFQCNPTSCPSGCCNGNTCVPYASQDNATCGVAGNACAMCAADRICAKASTGCTTWCGTRSVPPGVAAGDYACTDFENGMPPANAWVPSVQDMSVLQITNVALSVPNGLETIAVGSTTFGNEALLKWTAAPTTTQLKKVSVSAAMNPGLFQRLDADYQVLCASMSAGFASSACIAFTGSGLKLRWRFYNGSGYIPGECDMNGGFANEQWTYAEVHLDATTGLTQAIVGGVTTNCQATDLPLADTVGFGEIGLRRDSDAQIGLQMRYDNVEISVRR